MIKLIRALWFGMFMDYHMHVGRKAIKVKTEIGITKARYHRLMALDYYEKAYGERFVKAERVE